MLTQAKKEWTEGTDAKILNTSFGYNTGSSKTTYDFSIGGNLAATTGVRQYADQVETQTVGGIETTYVYDAFGNVNRETITDGFVSNYTTVAGNLDAQTSNKTIYRSYNGFGQVVGEAIGTSPTNLASQSMWIYHPTGELQASWAGTFKNLTLYQYHTTGFNAGRLSSMRSGEGSIEAGNFVIDATHYLEDGYGYNMSEQVTTKNIDGFNYTYRYNSFGQLIQETFPSSPIRTVKRTYDYSLQEYGAFDSSTDKWTLTLHDELGRPIETTYHDTTPSVADDNTVTYQYDQFDRLVKMIDNRLSMNNPGNARATYYVYNSMGQLIKELKPAMRTAGGAGYQDTRRPYIEYTYDNIGRQTAIKQMVNTSSVLAAADIYGSMSSAMPANAVVAITKTDYDILGRPTLITDPVGYQNKVIYDNSNSVVKTIKQVCLNNNIDCTGNFVGETNTGGIEDSISTFTSYDAAGRPTKVIDSRGNSFEKEYNLLGNVTAEKQPNVNGNLITRFEYVYTDDGLLLHVKEPAIADGTSGLVTTKTYTYTNRRVPQSMRVAHHNTQSTSTDAPLTSYTYDWAGRVLTTVLPPITYGTTINSQIVQTYDPRGNLLSITDADGFKTVYTYDIFNRMISENKQIRTLANTFDNLAFPYTYAGKNGLYTQYNYDAAGNLVKENRGGQVTYYEYNTLGKVMAQDRSKVDSRAVLNLGVHNSKFKVYRLDGGMVAETDFSYNGERNISSPTTLSTIDAGIDKDGVIVTDGNLTLYTLNKRGEQVATRSIGYAYDPIDNNNAEYQQYYATFGVNGLGLRYNRDFQGKARVYAPMRNDLGQPQGTRTLTYWNYDANGNLLQKYDQIPNDSYEQNKFTYTYSPTNKEVSSVYSVRAEVGPGSAVWKNFTNSLSNGILIGATIGDTTTIYNNRDLVTKTIISDRVPKGVAGLDDPVGRISDYSFFQDGNKASSTVGSYSVLYNYDDRGRIAITTDQNGNDITPGDGSPINAWKYETQYINGKESQYVYKRIATEWTLQRCMDTHTTIGGLIFAKAERKLSGTSCTAEFSKYDLTVYNEKGQATYSNSFSDNDSVALTTLSTLTRPVSENPTKVTDYDLDLFGQELAVKSLGETSTSDKTIHETFYNPNGSVTSEKVYYTNGTSQLSTYKLDALDNRITVSGGAYNNYIKMYDPDGRVAQFNRDEWNSNNRWYYGYTFFRYDPYGNQVLAAKGTEWEGVGGNEFEIVRAHYSYIHAAGDVEVIRKRTGNHFCTDNSSSCGNLSWNDNAADNQRYKTETFSLIDSLYPADSFTLMQPYQAETDPTTTFAAPTDTISDQTGILATDVTAPVTVLPDTTEVTQPTDTTTPPATDEGVTPPVATQELGIAPGFGSLETTPLGTVGETGSLNVQTGVVAGEQGEREQGKKGMSYQNPSVPKRQRISKPPRT